MSGRSRWRGRAITFAISLGAIHGCSVTSAPVLREGLGLIGMFSLFALFASFAQHGPRASTVVSLDEETYREEWGVRALDVSARVFNFIPVTPFGALIATSRRLLYVCDGETLPAWETPVNTLLGASEGSLKGLQRDATAGRECLAVRYRTDGVEAIRFRPGGAETKRFLVREDDLPAWLELVDRMAGRSGRERSTLPTAFD